jgi:hypothetical protein
MYWAMPASPAVLSSSLFCSASGSGVSSMALSGSTVTRKRFSPMASFAQHGHPIDHAAFVFRRGDFYFGHFKFIIPRQGAPEQHVHAIRRCPARIEQVEAKVKAVHLRIDDLRLKLRATAVDEKIGLWRMAKGLRRGRRSGCIAATKAARKNAAGTVKNLQGTLDGIADAFSVGLVADFGIQLPGHRMER